MPYSTHLLCLHPFNPQACPVPMDSFCNTSAEHTMSISAPWEMVGCFSSNSELKFKCPPALGPASLTGAGGRGWRRLPLMEFSDLIFQPRSHGRKGGHRVEETYILVHRDVLIHMACCISNQNPCTSPDGLAFLDVPDLFATLSLHTCISTCWTPLHPSKPAPHVSCSVKPLPPRQVSDSHSPFCDFFTYCTYLFTYLSSLLNGRFL